MDQDCAPTGVPGLDDMICGGFERNSANLVIGSCGSGKTTFCMQFLYTGATRFNENGIYITFEENPDRLKKHMRSFGWDLDSLDKAGKLRIIRIPPMDMVAVVKENYGRLVNLIEEIGAKRIVIDSITGIESMIRYDYEQKENAIKLCDRLSKYNCTSLMVSEAEQTIGSYSRHGVMEFIADSVIILYNVQKGNMRENALEVLKMRGFRHSKKIVPFKIENGITVFPNEEFFLERK